MLFLPTVEDTCDKQNPGHVSAIDPIVKRHKRSLQYMLVLLSLATNVLMESEDEAYDLEVCRFHIDNA